MTRSHIGAATKKPRMFKNQGKDRKIHPHYLAENRRRKKSAAKLKV